MDNGQDTTQSPNGGARGEANGEANGEGKIGRVLERARQERGLSLDEAERATKIRKRYLVGLERDDYTVLPDAVYARGFLKTYANFLGLDGGSLSEEVRSRRKPRRERGINHKPPGSDFDKPLLTPGGVSGAEKRKIPTSTIVTVALAVVILAALIGALYYVGRGVQAEAGDPPPEAREEQRPSREAPQGDDAGEPEEQPAVEQDPAPAEDRGAGSEPVSDGAPLDALAVGVSVEGAEAWILVEADSEVVSEEVAPPGFSQTFEADRRVRITTGNAGAVNVVVNGQDAGPLGADGEVLTRNFTLKSAS